MNILCTGNKGFIGTNLVERLKKDGHSIQGYDIRESPIYDANYFPRLRYFIKNADVVFHLANIPAHRLSMENPHGIISNNYSTTLNVAEAVRRSDRCKKIVFASSFAVYGDNKNLPWTEKTSLSPTTPYGMCKIHSECLLKRYHDWYGIDVIIIRPSNVFGECEELHQPLQVIPKWLDDYKKGNDLVVHGSDTYRDWTYVGDVADGMVKASKKTGLKVYNLCSGAPVYLKDLAHKISNRVNIVELSDYETSDWLGSYEKAGSELGFTPTKTIGEWIDERKKDISKSGVRT